MLTNSLDFQETLVEEIPSWTIQVIYPDDQNQSILSESETLVSVTETIVEDDIKSQDVVQNIEPVEKAKKPTRDTLPFADCWTPKGYICPNCQKVYNARKNLARHVNSECGKEPQYSCPYCEYKNYRRNEIKKHAKNKHHLLFT